MEHEPPQPDTETHDAPKSQPAAGPSVRVATPVTFVRSGPDGTEKDVLPTRAGARPREVEESAAAGAWTTDLGCPECGYNLRGLPFVAGDVGDSARAVAPANSRLLVDCPECGLRSDLGVLAQRRWDRPWHKAPGFNLMVAPVAWLLFGGIAWMVATASQGGDSLLVTLAVSMTALAGWVALLWWVHARCGEITGVLFSLLAHLIFVGYLAGLILVLTGIVSSLMHVFAPPRNNGPINVAGVLIGVLMFVGGIVLFVVGRICEKQVAGHCIRLYLKRGTTS